jgi:glycosyltransferase involved in cell wall biosynthesis
MDISVVINTYNEAEKLPACLDSLAGWVDEIVVVDMGSQDRTLEILKKYQAKISPHKYLPYVEPARNFGLSLAQGNWILVIDPDERIPEALAQKLQTIVDQDRFEVVNIPRKNIIFGKWIRHSNWWPDYHVRFFKKGKVSWSERIHLYPKVEGRVLELPAQENLAIEHLNYETVSQFLERQNRYSGVGAQNRFDEGERFSFLNFFWKPMRVFLQRYVRHAGFADGFYGFALCVLSSYAQLCEEVKLWEKEKAHENRN